MTKATTTGRHSLGRRQHLGVEEFFYFFLRLRKNEVRQTVGNLELHYPDDDLATRARRLTNAKLGLALVGGSLLQLPGLIPTVGQALKIAGVVGASQMLTRMHLYLILEIACVYGEDIDDVARVPEMIGVVAATGLGALAPSLLSSFQINPLYSVPAGALSMATATKLIGASAAQFYGSGARANTPEPVPAGG
ncbi:MAG: hypothetical protein WBG92_03310 [Thiohalocapsa sp.]